MYDQRKYETDKAVGTQQGSASIDTKCERRVAEGTGGPELQCSENVSRRTKGKLVSFSPTLAADDDVVELLFVLSVSCVARSS
jgi:hypothetical protein